MKSKKKVHIRSDCFDITINFNGPVFSSLLCLLVVIILLLLFVKTVTVVRMLLIFLGIEFLIILVLLLKGFSVETEEYDVNTISDNKEEVNNTVSEKGDVKKGTIKNINSEKIIKNKVPIPNAPSSNSNQTTLSDNSSSAPNVKVATNSNIEMSGTPMADIDSKDWADIFRMDDDDI